MRRFLFVFDTTGSMSRWIKEVRQHVALIAGRVLEEGENSGLGSWPTGTTATALA